MKKTLIALRLKPSDLAVLKEIAAARGETLSASIRDVVEDYVQAQLKNSPALTKLWQKSLAKSKSEAKQ